VFGRRVKRQEYTGTALTKTEQFVHQGQNVWADLDQGGVVQARYAHGDGVDQLAAKVAAAGVRWYVSDRQGSVVAVLNGAGAVQERAKYAGFGAWGTSFQVADRYGYTGRGLDDATGQQFNRARYLEAGAGRWTTEDPTGFAADDPTMRRHALRQRPWPSPQGRFLLRSACAAQAPFGGPQHLGAAWERRPAPATVGPDPKRDQAAALHRGKLETALTPAVFPLLPPGGRP
jgi:RHS repeat-associated protein